MNRTDAHSRTSADRSRSGFTAIEVIVALAIAGVLMGIGAATLRPPAARLAASASASFVQQARFEAIRSNRPVVVRVDGNAVTLHRATTATSVDCAASLPTLRTLRTLDLAEFRNVTVSDVVGFPFVWLPSGEARTCPSGASPLPLDGLRLRLDDASTARTLVVEAGGTVGVR